MRQHKASVQFKKKERFAQSSSAPHIAEIEVKGELGLNPQQALGEVIQSIITKATVDIHRIANNTYPNTQEISIMEDNVGNANERGLILMGLANEQESLSLRSVFHGQPINVNNKPCTIHIHIPQLDPQRLKQTSGPRGSGARR